MILLVERRFSLLDCTKSGFGAFYMSESAGCSIFLKLLLIGRRLPAGCIVIH